MSRKLYQKVTKIKPWNVWSVTQVPADYSQFMFYMHTIDTHYFFFIYNLACEQTAELTVGIHQFKVRQGRIQIIEREC